MSSRMYASDRASSRANGVALFIIGATSPECQRGTRRMWILEATTTHAVMSPIDPRDEVREHHPERPEPGHERPGRHHDEGPLLDTHGQRFVAHPLERPERHHHDPHRRVGGERHAGQHEHRRVGIEEQTRLRARGR